MNGLKRVAASPLVFLPRRYATYVLFAALAIEIACQLAGVDVPPAVTMLTGGAAFGSLFNTDKDRGA